MGFKKLFLTPVQITVWMRLCSRPWKACEGKWTPLNYDEKLNLIELCMKICSLTNINATIVLMSRRDEMRPNLSRSQCNPTVKKGEFLPKVHLIQADMEGLNAKDKCVSFYVF